MQLKVGLITEEEFTAANEELKKKKAQWSFDFVNKFKFKKLS